jgi:hypothetical protein
VLGEIGKRFTIVNMSTHAREILRREPPLREVDARTEAAA